MTTRDDHDDFAAYWDHLRAGDGDGVSPDRICHGAMALLSVAGLVSTIGAHQWVYVVVFAVFLAGTGVSVWVTAQTIALDRYGQPVSGRDADRLSQLKLRNPHRAHAMQHRRSRHRAHEEDDHV